MPFEQIPYTNFHGTNQDWMIQQIKQMIATWASYQENFDQWRNNLDAAFNALHDYVYTYFDELDVQKEINNKLDQMREDGVFDEILLPYFEEYTTNINNTVANQNSRITTVENEVNNFLENTGTLGTEKDPELIDIRVGADGVTYATAGEAVRTQLTNHDNDIEAVTCAALTAPVSLIRLTQFSYWTFGNQIIPENGYTASNQPAYARTTFVPIDKPILIDMDSDDYEWCIWGYSANTAASGTYSPLKRYDDKPLIIRPIKGTISFRIGFRRKDLANLTSDYDDNTSDAYKILSSLKTYIIATDNFDISAPASADAVKANTLFNHQIIMENADLNTIMEPGFYGLTNTYTYANSPITSGILIVYATGSIIVQIAHRFGSIDSFVPEMYIRCKSGTGAEFPTAWKKINRGRKYNINMACFGDSIMYGTNGNTSDRVDDDLRIPSIISNNLNINTVNYGVGSQGYLGLIEETAYDNISSKDLTQFNAMLMCYGVNDGYKHLGEWNSTDETTIMGQFNKIINYVFAQNPTIRLIVVAPYNGRNVGTFPKYWYGDRDHPQGYVSRQVLSDTLKQACEYYNIPYIEQKNSPINGFTIKNLIGTDGVHPSITGYIELGNWLAGEISKLIS